MKKVKAQLGARQKRKPSQQQVAPVVGQLLKHEGDVPGKVRRQILDLGAHAVPFLIELIREADALEEEVGHTAFVRHAVDLLGELAGVVAIPALLDLLEHTDDGDEAMQLTLTAALSKMGPAVVEPALRLLARSRDDMVRELLLDALSSSGVIDPRIADAQSAELDAVEAGDGTNPLFFIKATALAAALAQQGRELTAAQRDKVGQATGGGTQDEMMARMARLLAESAGGFERPAPPTAPASPASPAEAAPQEEDGGGSGAGG